MKTSEKHSFKKGQKLHLDEIYDIQSIAGGDWWTATDPFDDDKDCGETVTILQDLTIEITITRNSQLRQKRKGAL